MTFRIDAHQHFWQIAQRRGAWPPPTLDAIYQDFGPEDLAPLLAQFNVQGSVLVQSLPTHEDIEYLLDLASQNHFVRAVVGWVDLKSPDAPPRLASLARHPKLRGIRPMLQDLADDNWIAGPMLEPAIEAMLAHDLSFDALVKPRHLQALLGANSAATVFLVPKHTPRLRQQCIPFLQNRSAIRPSSRSILRTSQCSASSANRPAFCATKTANRLTA
ncbi:amidohydrolase family protein [Paraburkholderia sp. LEh10]|nr:amidohydrolase family protein [Paraburkholderia sp. LEh10]MBP0592616.1 amidohydrolase family protein [Paraburkholderia sp. LEh10]